MATDPKEAREYARKITEAFRKKPESLEGSEKRLARKYWQASDEIVGVNSNIRDLRIQIQQAEQRIQQLQAQAENEQGKCNGFLELLIEDQFGDDWNEQTPAPGPDDPPADPPAEAEASPDEGGNGGTPPKNRKARRAKKATAKKKTTKGGDKAAQH